MGTICKFIGDLNSNTCYCQCVYEWKNTARKYSPISKVQTEMEPDGSKYLKIILGVPKEFEGFTDDHQNADFELGMNTQVKQRVSLKLQIPTDAGSYINGAYKVYEKV